MHEHACMHKTLLLLFTLTVCPCHCVVQLPNNTKAELTFFLTAPAKWCQSFKRLGVGEICVCIIAGGAIPPYYPWLSTELTWWPDVLVRRSASSSTELAYAALPPSEGKRAGGCQGAWKSCRACLRCPYLTQLTSRLTHSLHYEGGFWVQAVNQSPIWLPRCGTTSIYLYSY